MEQYGDNIESVILVLDSNNYGIYQVLSPLYFPRSVHEAEFSRYQLPFEIGDPVNGEPIISDRRIRIIDNPQHAFQGKQQQQNIFLLELFPRGYERAVNLILVVLRTYSASVPVLVRTASTSDFELIYSTVLTRFVSKRSVSLIGTRGIRHMSQVSALVRSRCSRA